MDKVESLQDDESLERLAYFEELLTVFLKAHETSRVPKELLEEVAKQFSIRADMSREDLDNFILSVQNARDLAHFLRRLSNESEL